MTNLLSMSVWYRSIAIQFGTADLLVMHAVQAEQFWQHVELATAAQQ